MGEAGPNPALTRNRRPAPLGREAGEPEHPLRRVLTSRCRGNQRVGPDGLPAVAAGRKSPCAPPSAGSRHSSPPALALGRPRPARCPSAVAAPPRRRPATRRAGVAHRQLNGETCSRRQFGGIDYADYGLSIDLGPSPRSAATTPRPPIRTRGRAHQRLTPATTGRASTYAGALAKAVVLAQAAGADATVVRRRRTSSGPSSSPHGRRRSRGGSRTSARSTSTTPTRSASRSPRRRWTTRAAPWPAPRPASCSSSSARPGSSGSTSRKAAADQTCDGDGPPPGHRRHGARRAQPAEPACKPAVDAAVAKAVAWLKPPRGADGSFGGGGPPRPPTPTAPAWPAGHSASAARPRTPSRPRSGCVSTSSPKPGPAPTPCSSTRERWPTTTPPGPPPTRHSAHRRDPRRRAGHRAGPPGAALDAAAGRHRPGREDGPGEFKRAGSSVTLPIAGATPGDLVCVHRRRRTGPRDRRRERRGTGDGDAPGRGRHGHRLRPATPAAGVATYTFDGPRQGHLQGQGAQGGPAGRPGRR